jgi:hypothetical protein
MSNSIHDIPKKVQYIIVDSKYVQGSNNTFSLDLTLESNTHVEDFGRVLGVKMVDFYITQVGDAGDGSTDIAKFVDIVCPDIPKVGQMLDERHGQVFARVPLERHFTAASQTVLRDKQWKSFNRKTHYFNPISIKKLNFKIYEQQDDGDYVTLQPDAQWYFVLEVTTVDVKEKPVNKDVQILEALHTLIGKIEMLNQNVKKLPEKEEEKPKPKKISFNYILLTLALLAGGYVFYINKRGGGGPVG